MMDDIDRATSARKGSPFLSTAEAAHYINLSHRTLETMRLQNRGPVFRRHGRYIRYHIEELDAWSQGQQGKAPEQDERL